MINILLFLPELINATWLLSNFIVAY